MQLDYKLTIGLEEWVGGNYKITEDFYRLTIFTETIQKKLWHFFKKMVPLDCVIRLTKEEAEMFKSHIFNNIDNFAMGIGGLIGSYRVKSFTLDTFYGNEDAEATEEELSYDYEWSDL